MELKRLKAEYCSVFFEIEESLPGIGAYLYVELPNEERYDELQDSIEICKLFAEEEYGLPISYWENCEPILYS